MAASEILNIVPTSIYHEIKAKDTNPLFKAFVVGHEGTATMEDVDGGSIVKKWYDSAIKKLQSILAFGTKIFHGHNTDNSHKGREVIGEVVGKINKEINNNLSTVAIAYIYPQFRSLPLDIASIEADLVLSGGEIKDVNVEKITGIALGSSAIEKPGFPGATLVAQLQGFLKDDQSNHGGEIMDINEIKQFISSEKIRPSDIFGRDVLVTDPVIVGFVAEERKIASAGEYAHRKRTDEKFDSEREKWEKDKKGLEKDNSDLKKSTAKIQSKDLFVKKIKERKLVDTQKNYIEQKMDNFQPEKVENLNTEIDEFLDSQIKEFENVKKIFNPEAGDVDKKKTGAEPGDEDNPEDSSQPQIPD